MPSALIVTHKADGVGRIPHKTGKGDPAGILGSEKKSSSRTPGGSPLPGAICGIETWQVLTCLLTPTGRTAALVRQ